MGSQKAAKLSDARGSSIRSSMKEARLTPGPRKGGEVPASVALKAIGKFTKSNSFVQCLSSASTKAGLKLLIDFAGKLKYSEVEPGEILNQYGVSPEENHPADEFIEKAIEKLREDLTAQSRSTESAIAIEDALPRSVIDLLKRFLPKAQARIATREQFVRVFRKADSRDIANIAMEHVISSLINRILDAARALCVNVTETPTSQ